MSSKLNLQTLRQREQDLACDASCDEQLQELRRQHSEMCRALPARIAVLEAQQQSLQQCLAALQPLALDPEPAARQKALQQLRRAVQEAQMQLLKCPPCEPAAVPATGGSSGVELLTSLTFAQLSKLGFGLGWPLVLALLVAAGMILAGMLVVFKVG